MADRTAVCVLPEDLYKDIHFLSDPILHACTYKSSQETYGRYNRRNFQNAQNSKCYISKERYFQMKFNGTRINVLS